jgi:hypothetical protein
MIESNIEHVIYRLNGKVQAEASVIQGFLDQLAVWKKAIPPEYQHAATTNELDYGGIDIFVSDMPIPLFKSEHIPNLPR